VCEYVRIYVILSFALPSARYFWLTRHKWQFLTSQTSHANSFRKLSQTLWRRFSINHLIRYYLWPRIWCNANLAFGQKCHNTSDCTWNASHLDKYLAQSRSVN